MLGFKHPHTLEQQEGVCARTSLQNNTHSEALSCRERIGHTYGKYWKIWLKLLSLTLGINPRAAKWSNMLNFAVLMALVLLRMEEQTCCHCFMCMLCTECTCQPIRLPTTLLDALTRWQAFFSFRFFVSVLPVSAAEIENASLGSCNAFCLEFGRLSERVWLTDRICLSTVSWVYCCGSIYGTHLRSNKLT